MASLDWFSLLYAVLAVIAISCISLISILFIPILLSNPGKSKGIFAFLLSTAIGCLIGDVVFHLIPDIFNSAENDQNTILISQLSLLAGIYLFFIGEKLLAQYHHGHSHDQHHIHHGGVEALSNDIIPNMSTFDSSGSKFASSQNEEEQEQIITTEERRAGQLTPLSTSSSSSCLINAHDVNSTNNSEERKTPHSHIKPFALLVIFSDALHNIVDGLAIGISFATSFEVGLSTSLAVLFHEIPHEIGDYVILMHGSTGGSRPAFSHKKIIAILLASNLAGLFGAVVGFLVSGIPFNSTKKLVLAFTAGNFLYIALADLVPELQFEHNREHHHQHHDNAIITTNQIHSHAHASGKIGVYIGLLFGAALMYLIKFLFE